jgi:hypothetical protein
MIGQKLILIKNVVVVACQTKRNFVLNRYNNLFINNERINTVPVCPVQSGPVRSSSDYLVLYIVAMHQV